MVGSGAAELAEGDGVAAGFGDPVPAVAEGMRPLAVPVVTGRLVVSEVPGGGHHLLVVPVAAQAADVGQQLDAPVRETGGVKGLGDVFGVMANSP